ncbi:MAG: DUF1475 family protein [Acidimicrobiia bacterium]|nr:DUF1475 family protein [Acidimicrobiia bacterium]
MIAIRSLATLLAVVMAVAIGIAIVGGDFSEEGEILLGLQWGVVSLIDVYTGAALVAFWIWWRDGWRTGLAWLVLLVVLGHMATAAYVAWRSWTADSVESLLTGRVTGAQPKVD